jgi:CheY-like chemotaxis protein
VTSQKAARVLVVDDDLDTCQNLSDILSDLGYHVDYAQGGPAALELIRERSYDIALLDLKMPGMDGLALCREIKKQSAGTVPFLLTAYAGPTTEAEAPAAGAQKVFSKPVDARKLLTMLDQLAKKDEGA